MTDAEASQYEECKSHNKPNVSSTLVNTLPTELQSLILSKVDGPSLNNCRLVCKLWSDLIFRLEAFDNIWKKCCLLEIPNGAYSDIIDIYAPSVQHRPCDALKVSLESCNDQTSWKSIYGHFHRSKYIQDKPTLLTTYSIPTHYGMVTCLEVSENEMFLGFNDGSVICYDEYVISGLSPPCVVHSGTQSVDGIIAYRHSGEHGSVTLTVISVHHTSAILVSVIGRFGDAGPWQPTNFHILNYHTKPITSISRYGAYFTTSSSDTCLQGQPIWRLDSPGGATFVCKLTGHVSNKVVRTCLWRNQVISVDLEGNVMLWHFTSGITNELIKPRMIVSVGSLVHSFIYRNGLFVGLTGVTREKCLYVYNNGTQSIYNVFGCLRHIPERISLHGSLLAIGTEAGLLYVYVVPKESDWNSLNLQKYDQCVKVAGQHITGIYIDDHGSGPVMIVTSDIDHITIIYWVHE